MKLLAALLTTLAASFAFAACPNLTGTYMCTDENGQPAEQTIAQEDVNGQTVYSVTTSDGTTQLPTDNQEYPFDDAANYVSGTARFVCENDSVKKDLEVFNIYSKGQQTTEDKSAVVMTWDIVQGWSLDAQTNLSVAYKGTVTQDGQTSPIDQVETCTRATK